MMLPFVLFVKSSDAVVNGRLEDDRSTIKYLSEIAEDDTPKPQGAAFSRRRTFAISRYHVTICSIYLPWVGGHRFREVE
jgi:hypothetical protein